MRHLFSALLLLAAAPTFAGNIDKVRNQVVNRLAVSGTIEIDAQGKVLRYEIAHPEAYTQGVRDLLARDIQHWTFAPVLIDGVARPVRADMYLRLQAKPLGGDKYQVDIASAAFGREREKPPGTAVSTSTMDPPRYPSAANRAGVGAQTVVVVRIGRSGKVEDAVIEQTNLRVVADEKTMARWRDMFEDEALDAAKRWTFKPPTAGDGAGAPFWSLRIPVVYTPWTASPTAGPGQWESYVPGPRHRVPWDTDEKTAETGIDALPGGGVFPLHQDVHLLTPLAAG
jgi:TonB family protein